jgi:predicted GTPase
MSRWRIAIIAVLLCVPVAFFAAMGGYYVWQKGYSFYVWWPTTACLALGYFLAWYWLRQRKLLAPVESDIPMHWTERDKLAWKLIEARAAVVGQADSATIRDLPFYSDLAQQMALELARFYHPEASDPLSSLTIVEILAVIELASHDLAELVEQNVPGGTLMTVHNWRWAKDAAEKASRWWRVGSNLWWIAGAFIDPISTGVRWAASQAGTAKPMQLFQQDLVAWFHVAVIYRLGSYLIELNSGRLRAGATRYRQLKQAIGTPTNGEAKTDASAAQVTLTVFGQVKMGKSSFVNALLGEQMAKTDVLPSTAGVNRYELKLPNSSAQLTLQDTVGYAHTGPKEDQLRATQAAAQQSDVLVLVLHARNPARQADVECLQALRKWFTTHPELKAPPIIAVVTHIDLLSPAMEWAPPYNWQEPTRTKEKKIQQALAAVQEQLGDYLLAAVPACTSAGKVYGVEEWFLPALAELLGEAKAVSLVRCLRAEHDAGKVQKIIGQVLMVGGQLLDVWLSRRMIQKKQPEQGGGVRP